MAFWMMLAPHSRVLGLKSQLYFQFQLIANMYSEKQELMWWLNYFSCCHQNGSVRLSPRLLDSASLDFCWHLGSEPGEWNSVTLSLSPSLPVSLRSLCLSEVKDVCIADAWRWTFGLVLIFQFGMSLIHILCCSLGLHLLILAFCPPYRKWNEFCLWSLSSYSLLLHILSLLFCLFHSQPMYASVSIYLPHVPSPILSRCFSPSSLDYRGKKNLKCSSHFT